MFSLGRPLRAGWMMALRPAQERYISASFTMKHCPSVYNVFHPYDPLATR